jgi:hypothetical protein
MNLLFWRRPRQTPPEELNQTSPVMHLYSLGEQALIPKGFDPLTTSDMLRYATDIRGFSSIDSYCSTIEAREILEKLDAARKNGLDLAQSFSEEDGTRGVNPAYLIQEQIGELAKG